MFGTSQNIPVVVSNKSLEIEAANVTGIVVYYCTILYTLVIPFISKYCPHNGGYICTRVYRFGLLRLESDEEGYTDLIQVQKS